jgi:flavin reductase (DIM6/NTAB) family NADH-FMN oxidoreductase RutF
VVTSADVAAFRECLGHFPTGVTVVTARTEAGPVGFVVGSFFSVSLDPLLVGFAAGRNSSTWAAIKLVGSFCVESSAPISASCPRKCRVPATGSLG